MQNSGSLTTNGIPPTAEPTINPARHIPDTISKTETKTDTKRVVMVSNLPSKSHGHDGIGFYSGFFVKNSSKINYTVLCQITEDFSTEWDNREYGQNSQIFRSFNKNKFISVIPLINKIINLRIKEGIQNLHIQYEFFSYSSPIAGSAFTLITAIWGYLLGFRIILTLHQIPSLDDLRERLNQELKARFFYLGVGLVFWALALFTHKIIVHEQVFKDRLNHKFKIPSLKTEVISHLSYANVNENSPLKTLSGLDSLAKYPNKLLFFGYLSWYKGLDGLIRDFLALPEEIASQTALVIAGGPHPKQIEEEEYQIWLQNLKNLTKDKPNITWYGFVAQDEVETLFRSSSALVLSYRNIFSSSGPFAWSLAYHVPAIASGIMDYLAKEGILTYHDTKGFIAAVKKLRSNTEKYKNLAIKLNQERNVENIETKIAKLYI
jgi:glycosyltransferase involved in cell wall biosynthesis